MAQSVRASERLHIHDHFNSLLLILLLESVLRLPAVLSRVLRKPVI